MQPTPFQGVPVQLDKTRWLRYSRRAIFAVERKLFEFWGQKLNFVALLQSEQQFTTQDWYILAWGGLTDEDPSLSLADVEELIPIEMIMKGDLTSDILRAINLSLGGSETPEADANPKTGTEVADTEVPLDSLITQAGGPSQSLSSDSPAMSSGGSPPMSSRLSSPPGNVRSQGPSGAPLIPQES